MKALEDFKSLLQGFVKMINEEVNTSIAIGVIAMIVSYIIGISFMHRNTTNSFMSKRKKRDMEKAIELGHVVVGKRVNSWRSADDRSKVGAMGWSDYEYIVDGKKYKYSISGYGASEGQATVKLYWVDNPAKAFHEKNNSSKVSFLFIILAVLMGWLAYFVANMLIK